MALKNSMVVIDGNIMATGVDKATNVLLSDGVTNVEDALKKGTRKNNKVVGTDNTPYLTRRPIEVDDFTGYVHDKLVGGTIAYNQLVGNGNFQTIANWSLNSDTTYTVSNNTATVVTTAGSQNGIYQYITCIPGHKYFCKVSLKVDVAPDSTNKAGFTASFGGDFKAYELSSTNWETFYGILNCGNNTAANQSYVKINTINWINRNLYARDVILIDLTLMFGTEIANYLYSLETATSGAGVAKLQEWGFCTDSYYDSNTGSLVSTKASAHKVIGKRKNLIIDILPRNNVNADGLIAYAATGLPFELNIAPVIEGQKYTITYTDTDSGDTVYGFFYNRPKTGSSTYNNSRTVVNASPVTFTAPITGYIAFRSDLNATNSQIELGETATSYIEPSIITYPLGNVNLRGLYKLDANNKLYCDGDIYEANGTVTRKYGLVDLGTLNWSYSSTNNNFSTALSEIKTGSSVTINNLLCTKYPTATAAAIYDGIIDKAIGEYDKIVRIRDTSYSTAASFKTAMSGVYLLYELATPTTETATSFADPQSLIDATLEEYVFTSVSGYPDIPIGHETTYLGASEEEADSFSVPATPTTDGTYVLANNVAGGADAYGWLKYPYLDWEIVAVSINATTNANGDILISSTMKTTNGYYPLIFIPKDDASNTPCDIYSNHGGLMYMKPHVGWGVSQWQGVAGKAVQGTVYLLHVK